MLCHSKKEAALAKRKDAGKRSVVITEKWDRKGQQYAAKAVPFPFDSRDTYERSLRQPLGSEFNTIASFKCASLCAFACPFVKYVINFQLHYVITIQPHCTPLWTPSRLIDPPSFIDHLLIQQTKIELN